MSIIFMIISISKIYLYYNNNKSTFLYFWFVDTDATYLINLFAPESYIRGILTSIASLLRHNNRHNNRCVSRDIIMKRREDFERRKTTIATGGIKNSFVMGLRQQGTSVSGDR